MFEGGSSHISFQHSPPGFPTFFPLAHNYSPSSSHIQPTENRQAWWEKRQTSEERRGRRPMTSSRKPWKMFNCLRMAILAAKYWLLGIHMWMRHWSCDDNTMNVWVCVYIYMYTHTHTHILRPLSIQPHISGWVPLEQLSSDHWLVRPALKEIHE